MKLTFNPKYFLVTVLLFLVEVFIALYIKDQIIRPFVGDVLVVILIYTFIRIFFDGDYKKIILGVFIFACLVEVAQYFNIVDVLGVRHIPWLRIILGTTFTWWDILSYAIGALIVYFWEKNKLKNITK